MAVELKLNAEVRADMGKGASRRLRRANKVPAVLYGGNKEAASLTLDALQINRLLQEEAFYSQILTLNIGGKTEQAQLKAMQRHPYKAVILHLDLQRVLANQAMHAHVPLHFLGEEAVVKATGGVIHRDLIEVQIECLPKDLPQHVEVDLTKLELGQTLHLADIPLPKGVKLVGQVQDQPVVTLMAPRVGGDEAAGEEAASEDTE